MTDLLRTGASWLAGKLGTSASQSVTYRRGNDSMSLTATMGKSLLRLSSEYDSRVEHTDADFIFKATDLVLGSMAATPARGDTIDWTDPADGTVRRYEVAAPGGEPPWRWSDPFRLMIRAHAKYIGTVP